ncbi:uncharacterized protein ARMOST_00029 [Armillaria ostoyae]|uniref:Uncharacterized protein n=1 Tax=Armillaria ostoyae TaxID=47428 RepID=A0A284QJZ8_ARMOS|nr:uncharacterized protein ARMOST_00029 [Armillaria ostoyae]
MVKEVSKRFALRPAGKENDLPVCRFQFAGTETKATPYVNKNGSPRTPICPQHNRQVGRQEESY